MDIAALSMSMADTKLMQGVGTSMIKKSMEQVEQAGQQIIEMMDSVPIPEGSIDIRV